MKKLAAYILIIISVAALLFALGSCGKEEPPAHVHTASDWITDKKPTCTEDGSEHKECTECGEVLSENVLKASHSPASAVKENAVAPTCTAEGSYDSVVYCRDCRTELSRKTHTEALAPHTPSAEWITVLEPTCRDFGKRIKECTVCHATTDEAPISEYADHTPAEAVIEDFVDSTCSAAGSYNSVTYCSVCERKLSSQSFTVEAKSHNPVGDWYTIKNPTCKEEGLRHRICSVCGESGETEVLPKTTNHNKVIDPSVAPTYTEPGLTAGAHCSICGEVLIAQTVIPAKLQGLDIVSTR